MKIIYAESEYGYGNCDSCGHSGEVTVHVYDSITQLLQHKELKQQLLMAGWVPLKDIKDVQDKKVMEDKFFIDNYGTATREVDLLNMEPYTSVVMNSLAHGGRLLQQVDPNSVLPEPYRKQLADTKRSLQHNAKAKEEAKKQRAIKATQRKLDKAKKLLEEYNQKEE